MENRKQKLLETLDSFVNQRPGLDPRNYGDWNEYRRESAAITKDMHDYRAIRSQIAWSDSIGADAIIHASEHAFSGRLTIAEHDCRERDESGNEYRESAGFELSYCAGQYMPTEYRKAACAVLASAWRGYLTAQASAA